MTAAEQDLMNFLAERRSRPAERDHGLSLYRAARPFVVLAAVLAVGIGLNWLGERSQASAQAHAPADAERLITIMAERFVSQELHCPATASFPTTAVVAKTPSGWRVASYVDSQNVFGATVRNYWSAEVRQRGNEWQLINLNWGKND